MKSLTEVKAEPSGLECFLPGVEVYLDSAGWVDPFTDPGIFRGEECFDGSLKGWRRWTRPSPEPEPDPILNRLVLASMERQADKIAGLHDVLLHRIIEKTGSQKIVLVAILRAGLFVSKGLALRAERLHIGKIPVVALALFHEAGLDYASLQRVLEDYPGHVPVFVDGWTGRGVAVGEIRRSIQASAVDREITSNWKIATLIDPGHYGDIWASDEDIPVACAHFSAPEVLGFSRAFIGNVDDPWKAYQYPAKYRNDSLIGGWTDVFAAPGHIEAGPVDGPGQNLDALLRDLASRTGIPARDWKVGSNEVARTFVNRSPRLLMLGVAEPEAADDLGVFLYLARKRQVEVSYEPWMMNCHRCLAAVRLR